MQFSISQIIRASQLQFGLLSAETAAFLLLSMCEDSELGARQPDPTRLFLEPGGAVSSAPLAAAGPLQVDRALRQVLSALLAVSVGGNPRLVEVADGQGDGLPAFRNELNRALIPINRAAAQRALTRLHRRVAEVLAHAPGTPVEAPVEAAPLTPVAARRLPRRRPPLPAATQTVEVVSAAEIAVAAASFEVLAPISLGLEAAFPEIPESVTPFLGSLELEAYDPVPAAGSMPELAEDALGLTDPVARVAWQTDGGSSSVDEYGATALPETEEVQHAGPTEPDSNDESTDADSLTARFWSLPPTVERAEAAPEYAGGPALSPYLGDFLPAASEVNELLRDFAPEAVAPRHVLTRRLRRFTEAETVGEHSLTPPPVQTEPHVDEPVLTSAKRPPLLAWMASAAVVAGALCVRFYPAVPVVESASASRPATSCVAQVRVETERDAVVQLISAAGRLAQPGPLALFEHVLCAAETRVVVQLPDASQTQTPEWLQVPVPESGLRLAAEMGEPIVLRVFPSAR